MKKVIVSLFMFMFFCSVGFAAPQPVTQAPTTAPVVTTTPVVEVQKETPKKAKRAKIETSIKVKNMEVKK